MKNLKTKVIMSAFVLFFALVATIGSTYAWFTVSEEVTVNAINIDVTTENSLLIRLYDGEAQGVADAWLPSQYYHAITNDMLTAATTAGYDDWADWELTPVTAAKTPSTTNGTDYTLISPNTLGTIDITTQDRELTAAASNTSDGGFIELKFWLMSQATGHTVTLQDLSVTTGGSTNIVNAISVGTIEDDLSTNSHVFSPNPDYAFSFGPTDTGYITQVPLTTENADESDWNSVSDAASLITLQSLFYDSSTGAVANVSAATAGASATVATLVADSPELVTVRIWVEGWDAQADNDIMAANFSVTFKFVIKA